MTASHGLYVAAVLSVELVGKGILQTAPFAMSARDPLVPPRDEYEVGVDLQSPFPLLLKIESAQLRV